MSTTTNGYYKEYALDSQEPAKKQGSVSDDFNYYCF
jgi:hypothetical protein